MNWHNLQHSGFDPRHYWQQPPFPPLPVFFAVPEHTPGFYHGLPFFAGPVNQGMVQQQGQYPTRSHGRAPSWGPSRHQRMGSHRAETLYPINLLHQSSGTITRDRSTGTHPGMVPTRIVRHGHLHLLQHRRQHRRRRRTRRIRKP
jgi:hypothetical protein